VTIINLKGSQDVADWLDAMHRKTHLSKAAIIRLGMVAWAEKNGQPIPPVFGEGRD
jgi:hypothetical protein